MATTITTTTAAYATAGGRHVAVTSAGVIWTMHYDLVNTRFEFWWSDDDGATWTENTGLRATVAADRAGQSEFFIGQNDRAVFACCGSGGYLARFTPHIPTATVWWATLTSNTSQDTDYIRAKIFDYSATEYVALIFEANLGGELDWWCYKISKSTNAVLSEQRVSFATTGDQVDFDFQHTGDGKTAVTNPAIWVLWRDLDGNRTYVEKRAWNNTQRGWSTTASPRTVSISAAAESDTLACMWDGTRFVSVFFNNDTTTFPRWVERDSGDTVTTQRTVPSLADGDLVGLSLTRDGEGDTRLYAIGASSGDVARVTFDRSAGTFGSWEELEATTAVLGTLSVQAGYQGNGAGLLFTAGAGSPYSVVFEHDPFNAAPLAPSWVSPPDASAIDITQSLTLDWTFNDPDDGDTQKDYALQRVVNGGSIEYFNAGLGTWGASEIKNTSGTSAVTLTTAQDGFSVDGDVVVYKVKTWDASDEPGPYSSALTLTGSSPVTPVLTAPADAATITANTIGVVEWTATEQTAYRLRLLTSGGSVLYDSGKVTADDLEASPSTVLTDGLTDAVVEIRVWNDDDLEGPVDSHTFSVDFVAPATPTLVVAAVPASAHNLITVTNPTPTGSQPTVTSHDLFVRVAAGGTSYGERPVGGDGIRIIAADVETVLYDYAAALGVPVEYMVRANASNGTSADSAWT